MLAAADPGTAAAAAAVMDRFAGTFDQDQRRDLDLLTQVQPASSDEWLRNGEPAQHPASARSVELTLPGLALKPVGPAADDLLIGQPGDRQAAVMILQAGLQRMGHPEEAVATLKAAATQTTSRRLRTKAGMGLWPMNELAHLIWERRGRPPGSELAAWSAASDLQLKLAQQLAEQQDVDLEQKLAEQLAEQDAFSRWLDRDQPSGGPWAADWTPDT